MHTRQTLIMKIKSADNDEAWGEFVQIYRPYIMRIICSFGLQEKDAEDISQTTLLKLWERISEFTHNSRKGAFRAWLARVVKNETINFFRKKKSLDNKLESLTAKISEFPKSDLEKRVEDEWNDHIANLAWKSIENEFDETTRQSFLLSLEKIPVDEIAEKLGITTSTVYVGKSRITQKLQQKARLLKDEYI